MPRTFPLLALLAACQSGGPTDHPLAEGHGGALNRSASPPPTMSFASTTTVLSTPTSGYAVGADVNGDGYRDVVVTRTGSAWVYLGGAAGLASSPSQSFTAPTSGGARLFYAGDVDGDGDEEVLFTRYQASGGRGAAWLCRGSATGLNTTCRQVATGAATTTALGVGAAAGDLNGDGYDDLAIEGNDGSVSILRGGVGAGRPSAWTSLSYPTTVTGFDIAIGNFNGDAYDDLAIGRWQDGYGAVYVNYGGTRLPFRTQGIGHPFGGGTYYCGDTYSFGYAVGVPGDTNGDGRDEVWVGAPYDLELCGGGYGYMFYGGGFQIQVNSWSEWSGASSNNIAWMAPGRGDYNGDGTADVVLGYTELGASYSGTSGYTRSSGGSENLIGVTPIVDLGSTSAPRWVSVGDVNGDGFDDILATTPNGTSTRMELLYGAVSDQDGDGVNLPDDCDDSDASIYPGAPDTCGDGVDSNCDGLADECTSAAFTPVVAGFAEIYYENWAIRTDTDVTGDGAPDLVVGQPYNGGVKVLNGPVGTGMDGGVDTTFSEPTDSTSYYPYFGREFDVGDLDGDGAVELVVGCAYCGSTIGSEGAVYVYDGPFGAGTVAPSAAKAKLEGEVVSSRFGEHVAISSDLTGDGAADLLVASGGYQRDREWFVFPGSVSGNLNTASASFTVTFPGSTSNYYTYAGTLLSPGDLDGDGLDDLVVGNNEGNGSVSAFYGPLAGNAGLGDADASVPGGSGCYYLGGLLSDLGDLDGDGLPDLAAGSYNGVFVFTDWSAGSHACAGAWAAFTGMDPNQGYGDVITADVTGDGVEDVVMGDPYTAEGGLIRAWAGPVSGSHDGSDALAGWQGQDDYPGLGYEVINAGDLDSDGRDDLYTTEIQTPSYASGVVWLIPGSLF